MMVVIPLEAVGNVVVETSSLSVGPARIALGMLLLTGIRQRDC